MSVIPGCKQPPEMEGCHRKHRVPPEDQQLPSWGAVRWSSGTGGMTWAATGSPTLRQVHTRFNILLSPPRNSSYFFKQTSPQFQFTLGLVNSVASPAQEAADKGQRQVRAPVVCSDTSGPAICLAPSWCGCGKRGLLGCI